MLGCHNGASSSYRHQPKALIVIRHGIDVRVVPVEFSLSLHSKNTRSERKFSEQLLVLVTVRGRSSSATKIDICLLIYCGDTIGQSYGKTTSLFIDHLLRDHGFSEFSISVSSICSEGYQTISNQHKDIEKITS